MSESFEALLQVWRLDDTLNVFKSLTKEPNVDMVSERDYTIALASCPGLEPATLRKLIAGCGSARNVWDGGQEDWLAAARISPGTVRRLTAWIDSTRDASGVETRLLERRIGCVVKGDKNYPSRLYDLENAPAVIFVRGHSRDIGMLFQRDDIVSVVGTRRASAYAVEATRWIVGTLARSRWHVVSGLALGIDICAHQSALEVQGVTSAVLACGVDLCYPVNHKRTYDAILEHGCIISEYPPGTPVAKHRFPERNRLIAALSPTLIVVQAGEKSGALLTAGMALDLGRDVYAVPGPITSVHFRGSNRLLADGAGVLLNPEEFLLEQGQTLVAAGFEQTPPERWRRLYEMLQEPLGASALSEKLLVPVSHVYAGLLELELDGFVQRKPGGVYQRNR
ncbi:DNA-processing protein DprA [Alicyclobacillus ferrooxydans]|nr:DNA-processing protein DprA [Alicyclobacillus ferrooxydans]